MLADNFTVTVCCSLFGCVVQKRYQSFSGYIHYPYVGNIGYDYGTDFSKQEPLLVP